MNFCRLKSALPFLKRVRKLGARVNQHGKGPRPVPARAGAPTLSGPVPTVSCAQSMHLQLCTWHDVAVLLMNYFMPQLGDQLQALLWYLAACISPPARALGTPTCCIQRSSHTMPWLQLLRIKALCVSRAKRAPNRSVLRLLGAMLTRLSSTCTPPFTRPARAHCCPGIGQYRRTRRKDDR